MSRIAVVLLFYVRIAFALSLSSSLSQECVSQIRSACIPTIAVCAADICYLCTSLGILPSIEPCCAAPTPTACFAKDYVFGVTSSAAHPITLPTKPVPSNLATVPGATFASGLALSCQSQASVVIRCSASTPDFGHLAFSDLQSCLCSTSGTFAPSVYDNFYSACLSYQSLVDPSEYSADAPAGGGIYTGVHNHQTFLGSRPCEAFYEITLTRTSTPSSSGSASPPNSSGLVSTSPTKGLAQVAYNDVQNRVREPELSL